MIFKDLKPGMEFHFVYHDGTLSIPCLKLREHPRFEYAYFHRSLNGLHVSFSFKPKTGILEKPVQLAKK